MDLSHITCPKGIKLRVNKNSVTIQVQFSYRSETCRESYLSVTIPPISSASDQSKFEYSIQRSLKNADVVL